MSQRHVWLCSKHNMFYTYGTSYINITSFSLCIPLLYVPSIFPMVSSFYTWRIANFLYIIMDDGYVPSCIDIMDEVTMFGLIPTWVEIKPTCMVDVGKFPLLPSGNLT